MGMKTGVFYASVAITFLGLSIAILVQVNEKDKALRFNRYQSLHPMQAPFDLAYNFQVKDFTSVNILISDISTISFNTPGLPSRLASAAHIGMMLHEPNPLPSIVYPIIDKSTKSRRLFGLSTHDLQMKDGAIAYAAVATMFAALLSGRNQSNASAVAAKQLEPENIQDMFVLDDADTLTLKQTDYYCPIRGPNSIEEYADWTKRTEQPHDTFADRYTSHMEFSYTNIHEKKCHAQRTDSMVMAHVAVDLYSVFSTHSTGSLLLGVTTLGFAFASFAAINSLYAHIDNDLQKPEEMAGRDGAGEKESHRKREMQLHTLTTLLKLVCVVLVVSFLSVEYMYKTDHADWTKNKVLPTSSFLCVFGASVLALLILYMHGPSKMIGKDVRMNSEIKKYCEIVGSENVGIYLRSMGVTTMVASTDNEKVLITRGLFPSLDLIREKIESEKEVLMYSYSWFVVVPLFFMALYADKTYGVDLHMQLIVLAVLVGCTLDILYVRMAMIIDVVWDIYIKNYRDDRFDCKVLGTCTDDEKPSNEFKMMIIALKFMLWVLFVAIRFTIVLIPYQFFHTQCTMNCPFIEASIWVFEVIPILMPGLDQWRTWQNKDYDYNDLVGETAPVSETPVVPDSTLMAYFGAIERKHESLRVSWYCVVYYVVLTVTSIVFCAQHLAQHIPDNDARLDVWPVLRTS